MTESNEQPQHPAPPDVFESARLSIRKPDPQRAEMLNAAVRESFDELHRWMPWAQRIPSVEETYAYQQEAVEKWDARVDFGMNLLDGATGEFIGNSGLHRMDWSVPRFEIGYWCRTSHAGRGYVTEAVIAIAEMAFAHLGARRVEIRCSTLNTPSRRVAEKAGFVLEGVLCHNERDPDGTLRDTAIYAMVR